MNAVFLAILIAAAQDKVLKRDNSVVKGTVKQDSHKGVQVDGITIPAEQVLRVDYADAPPSFPGALAALAEEKWDDAVAGLKSAWQRVKEEKEPSQIWKCRPWFEQYYLYHLGLCERQLGRFDDALKRLAAYREGMREPSRFWADSFDLSLQCLREKGDAEEMVKLVATIDAAPKELQSALRKRSQKEQAEILFDKKDYPKAKELFQKLQSDSNAGIRADATGGILRCLEEMKAPDELKKFCDQVLKDSGAPAGVRLIASNAMGRALRVAKDYKTALRYFVESAVIYNPGRGSGLERDHEEALYQLGLCYRELAGAVSDPPLKRYYLNAGAGALREVSMEYPSGRYREEANRLAEQWDQEASKLKEK